MTEFSTKRTPTIDPEFARRLPPLTEEERGQLEANILADGCRDPLVVWAETGILLDGHHRLQICQKHGLQYTVVTVNLPDRAAALDWVDRNALGTRNLTRDQLTIIIGRRYLAEKGAQGGTGANQYTQSGQNDHSAKTAVAIAADHGVSEKTVRRAGRCSDPNT